MIIVYMAVDICISGVATCLLVDVKVRAAVTPLVGRPGFHSTASNMSSTLVLLDE